MNLFIYNAGHLPKNVEYILINVLQVGEREGIYTYQVNDLI